jgi:hypothetical protein
LGGSPAFDNALPVAAGHTPSIEASKRDQRSQVIASKEFSMKGTKSLFRLGAIALALSLMVLTGCSTDSDDGGGSGGIVGKWYATQADAETAASVLYEFKSDGTLLSAGMSGLTYSVSGSTITFKYTASGQTFTMGTAKWSVSGTALTLSEAPSGIVNGTYYKKQ